MDGLQEEIKGLNKAPRLSATVYDVDKIIEELEAARAAIAATLDTHTASLTTTKLQNPMNKHFESMNQDLKSVSKVHKSLGKALDKALPLKPLPTDHDAMGEHTELINRAIAMHLLREGEFSVAETFVKETNVDGTLPAVPDAAPSQAPAEADSNGDHLMSEPEAIKFDNLDNISLSNSAQSPSLPQSLKQAQAADLPPSALQGLFSDMYHILDAIKSHDLTPAIEWARYHSQDLDARGSNFEFELSQLQYVWLFKGAGLAAALQYARENFPRFQARHLHEIQQLASAMIYASNLPSSPYSFLFETNQSFEDIAASFTREFCSLLGLSAESPLYVAATAGALALPRLLKYTATALAKGTAWTTTDELAFETPLPANMIYHSIFVCPVSKEQTTEGNPPWMIPCGHVLAKETLQRLCKGNKYKCPYCPGDGTLNQARPIIL